MRGHDRHLLELKGRFFVTLANFYIKFEALRQPFFIIRNWLIIVLIYVVFGGTIKLIIVREGFIEK